mgnify:CR=1 FL=1
MSFRRILSCVLGLISLLTIGGVSATWNYAKGGILEDVNQSVDLAITEWIYLPDEEDTETEVEVGHSYLGVLEVVLNDSKFGINPDGMIPNAFYDGKLLEDGIVHSKQNNLSKGNLNNVLAKANSQHLQFTVTLIEGTNPIEYYLYIYEEVTAENQTVGVYRIHIVKQENGLYGRGSVKYGEAITYKPKGAGFDAVKVSDWVEKPAPKTN